MDIYCNPAELQYTEPVVMVDMYSKVERTEPIAITPKEQKFVLVDVTFGDGKSTQVKVPVAKILMYPVGEDGQLVSPEKMTSFLVESFDKNGRMLESSRFFKHKVPHAVIPK